MSGGFHPVTVQENSTLMPQPGARCTECGRLLRTNTIQLVPMGAELFLSYWCANNECYRYGVHVHTFKLGEPKS